MKLRRLTEDWTLKCNTDVAVDNCWVENETYKCLTISINAFVILNCLIVYYFILLETIKKHILSMKIYVITGILS